MSIPLRVSLLLLTAVLVGLAACNQNSAEPTTSAEPQTTATPAADILGQAPVDSIEVLLLESFPVQVNVIAKGNLPDGCTEIDQIEQTRQDNAFQVTITTRRPGDAACTEQLVPFEEVIPLEVENLPAGNYSINANGALGAFALTVDNGLPTATPEPTLAPTPEPAGLGNISGRVWHDVCAISGGEGGAEATGSEGCVARGDSFVANGILDPDEPGLPGALVTLNAGACPGASTLASATTDADGLYNFSNISAGDYCVFVNASAEPNAALLIPGEWTAPANAQSPGSTTVAVVGGETTADVNFGWDYQFLPEPEATPEANCIDLAAFGGDITIPDDTLVQPGEVFVKTWRFVNGGGCTWISGYALTFAGGEQMGAPDVVPITLKVPTGGTVDVSVTLTAPSTIGVYRSDWNLTHDGAIMTGVSGAPLEAVWAQVQVTAATDLASVTGIVWDDVCDSRQYTFGSGVVPTGCVVNNENGTVRGNGNQDLGETLLGGVVVTLGVGECGDADPIRTTITDANGVYKFWNLLPNTYCVYIDPLFGTNYDLLLPGAFTVPSPGLGGTTATLTAGQALEQINFAWDFAEVSEPTP